MKLNKDQKKLTAEILGNIAVTWFAAGVIPVFFIKNLSFAESVRSFSFGFIMCVAFSAVAIYLLKR